MPGASGIGRGGEPASAGQPGRPRVEIDDLDRHIVAQLRADGRASWTEIARRCDSSVATVSRRGQQLLARKVVEIAVVPATTHPGHSSMYYLQLSCRAGMQVRVARTLAGYPDIRFLSIVSGPYDIAVELCADTAEPLVAQLVTRIQQVDGVDSCRTNLILHEYKVAQDWTWHLLEHEEVGPVQSTVTHVCAEDHVDDLDRQIVAAMRKDGRARFRVVAGAVGIDETTVRRRFEALRARGCIQVVTLAPAAALGFTPEVLVDVHVEPGRLHSVAETLTSFVGVRFVAATLGGSSLLCEVIQPTQARLFEFLTETLATLDGVRNWQASMELLTIRRGFVETPWWESELGVSGA